MCARSKIHAFNSMDPPEWQRTIMIIDISEPQKVISFFYDLCVQSQSVMNCMTCITSFHDQHLLNIIVKICLVLCICSSSHSLQNISGLPPSIFQILKICSQARSLSSIQHLKCEEFSLSNMCKPFIEIALAYLSELY